MASFWACSTVGLGCLLLLLVEPAMSLICRCNVGSSECEDDMTCQGSLCEARNDLRSGLRFECHESPAFGTGAFCNRTDFEVPHFCCDAYPLCNEDLVPFLPTFTTAQSTDTTAAATTSDSTDGEKNSVYAKVTIAVPVVSAILIVMIIIGTPLILLLLRQRKTRIERRRHEDHDLSKTQPRDPSPMFSPYSLDTLDLDDTCTSGSGSGEPLLSQRTVARSIRVGEPIGSGRFGQVFIGEFQGDFVAVKKFASRDEKSWFRESEVYNTVLLRHDNILGFFACDVFSDNGITELWLITHYHANGSLYDYLNRTTVTPKIMMRMVISICKGLTHLHTEFKGTSAKPAIAHRDMKSKNVLVKNGLECCIADFGLAVIKGPSSNVNFPTNPKQGTKRYMAPEVLNETIDMTQFECFKHVDVYAFGLILWEVCKRCGGKNDTIGEYEPPYHGMVGPDPSFDEMKKVVVVDKRRPTFPPHWTNDDLLSGLSEIMRECWYSEGEARNEILYYKMKLFKLAEEDKIEFDVQE